MSGSQHHRRRRRQHVLDATAQGMRLNVPAASTTGPGSEYNAYPYQGFSPEGVNHQEANGSSMDHQDFQVGEEAFLDQRRTAGYSWAHSYNPSFHDQDSSYCCSTQHSEHDAAVWPSITNLQSTLFEGDQHLVAAVGKHEHLEDVPSHPQESAPQLPYGIALPQTAYTRQGNNAMEQYDAPWSGVNPRLSQRQECLDANTAHHMGRMPTDTIMELHPVGQDREDLIRIGSLTPIPSSFEFDVDHAINVRASDPVTEGDYEDVAHSEAHSNSFTAPNSVVQSKMVEPQSMSNGFDPDPCENTMYQEIDESHESHKHTSLS
jgi:hypothetical protein